jgi:hypothetical protein
MWKRALTGSAVGKAKPKKPKKAKELPPKKGPKSQGERQPVKKKGVYRF